MLETEPQVVSGWACLVLRVRTIDLSLCLLILNPGEGDSTTLKEVIPRADGAPFDAGQENQKYDRHEKLWWASGPSKHKLYKKSCRSIYPAETGNEIEN